MGQSQQYVHAKPKQYMTQMISTIVRGKKNFASFEIVIISSIRVEKVWFDVTNKANNMEQQTFSRVNFFLRERVFYCNSLERDFKSDIRTCYSSLRQRAEGISFVEKCPIKKKISKDIGCGRPRISLNAFHPVP